MASVLAFSSELAAEVWVTTKLRIKLFQDGAELSKMIGARKSGLVDGFTTNPTLMRKAGVSDYKEFAQQRDCRHSRSAHLL